MKIFYEDKYLVVCEKAPGIASQGDTSNRENMISLLCEKCASEIFCVHRLDVPTGGVMVYAKDSRTAGRLSEALSNGEKEYICVCHGTELEEGEMEDILWHDKRLNKGFVVDRERKGAKKARLTYKSLAKKDGLSLMRVKLETGRTHQIRIQFSSRKSPLAGDGKYGARDDLPLGLYCFSLSFIHPITKKKLKVENLPKSPWLGFDLEEIFK